MEAISAIGWKTVIGAGLGIILALLTWYLKSKEIFPFKPRLKKVTDLQKEKEGELDELTAKDKRADYYNAAGDILDDADRLSKAGYHKDTPDK